MLKSLGGGLHYAEAEVTFYGVNIQTRMSVVELPGGGLLVISPLILTDVLRQSLDALGPVMHLASPNKIHNQGLESFMAVYPEAQIWASPGLPERRPELNYAGVLDDTPHADWAPVLDQLVTRGNIFFSEVVFFHRDSRTLIVADLVENLAEDTVPSAVGRQAARAMHIFGKALPSPEFRLYTTDAQEAAAGMDAMAVWPFERILMAHGTIITAEAHEVLAEVRDFLVAEVESRPAHRAGLYQFLARHQ